MQVPQIVFFILGLVIFWMVKQPIPQLIQHLLKGNDGLSLVFSVTFESK